MDDYNDIATILTLAIEHANECNAARRYADGISLNIHTTDPAELAALLKAAYDAGAVLQDVHTSEVRPEVTIFPVHVTAPNAVVANIYFVQGEDAR